MKILGDQPIKDKSEDALDRSDYAEHISTGILKWESKVSLCLALHGTWGSGKTSIINLCLKAIKEKTKEYPLQDKPIIIRFQPWLISGQEQLIKAFLEQLRKALGKPGLSKYANEASQHLETFENLLGYATWIPKVGRHAEKIKNLISMVKGTTQSISKQFEEDIEANKNSICNALSKLQSPVVIVIDDVDRLTSDEIRQLFQLIKAVADFPNTIYLLAFDHMLVEKALEPFQAGSETRYLEKIVQLSFEVPSPSRSQIATVLWNGLDTIVKTIPSGKYEQSRWNEIKFGPLTSLCRNIRDVKRYLNAVNFKFPIVKDEVSTVDLLIVEAIYIFAPPLYKVIKNNKDFLVSDSPRAMSSRDDKEKDEWINRLPQFAPEYCRKEMKEMLSHLFPEVESVFEKHRWGGGFLQTWTDNQRICISSYFDYYFQGTLPEGEVSAKEAKRIAGFLNDKSNLTSILKHYMSDTRITKLLPKVEKDIEKSIDENKILNLIIAIFESGEDFPLKPDGILELPSDWAIQDTVYRLLKLLNKEKRKDILIKAMNESENAIVFPLGVASWIWKEWNSPEKNESQEPETERLLSAEDTDIVKDAALSLIRKHKDTEILYKSRHLLSTLYYWEKWGNIEEVKEWVVSILSDERKIPEFLGGCGGFVGSVGFGSHYASYKFKVNIKGLKKYCDIDQLKIKCEELKSSNPEWFTNDYKEIIKAFIESFDENNIR